MKPHLVLLAALALASAAVQAENAPQPPDAPPVPPAFGGPPDARNHRMRDAMRDRFLDRLPPEARKRFEDAREKAMQDPKLVDLRSRAEAANREFFDAMRKRMGEIDPGLEGLLKQHGKDFLEKGPKGGDRGVPLRGMGDLSEAERQRLMSAREVAKQAPAVQAAEAKRDAAKTPEERETASQEFLKAMRAAILAADPGLEPVLDKLGHRHPHGGPPPPMAPPPMEES